MHITENSVTPQISTDNFPKRIFPCFFAFLGSDKIIDSQIIIRKISQKDEKTGENCEIINYFIILLYEKMLSIVQKEIVAKENENQGIFEDKIAFNLELTQNSVKLIRNCIDSSEIMLIQNVPEKNELIFTTYNLEKLEQAPNIQKVSFEGANLINSENISMYNTIIPNKKSHFPLKSLYVTLTNSPKLFTIQLCEDFKSEQIWSSKNLLLSEDPKYKEKCLTNLRNFGIQLTNEPKNVVLESLFWNGNHQAICDYILQKSEKSRGSFIMPKYKYIIDFVCEKFEALRLQIDLPTLHNSFLPSLYDLLSITPPPKILYFFNNIFL